MTPTLTSYLLVLTFAMQNARRKCKMQKRNFDYTRHLFLPLCLYFYTGKRSKRCRIASSITEIVNLLVLQSNCSCLEFHAAEVHEQTIFWTKMLQMCFRKEKKTKLKNPKTKPRKPQTHTHTHKIHKNKTLRKAERCVRSNNSSWMLQYIGSNSSLWKSDTTTKPYIRP